MIICTKCIYKNTELCDSCRDHPIVQNILLSLPKFSNFAYYKPVCPRGYTDCVTDPAYIKFHYPDWYTELYGDLNPEEAIYKENGCWDRYQKDPNENYYCYDDEDK